MRGHDRTLDGVVTCLMADCERSVFGRGLCHRHYEVEWRRGRLSDFPAKRRRSLPDRFWLKVDKTSPSGCWIWTGTTSDGYGRFAPVHSQSALAHRFAYELVIGPIPEGLELDHLCRVRNCVNPAHLEPVTSRENILRGNTLPARNAAKTHCDNGHPFDEDNTYIYPNGRHRECRTCRRASKIARRRAERSAS